MVSEPVRDPITDHLLTPQNSALVVIDYQPSQVQTVASIDHDVLIDNIVSVARLATTYDLPVVLSTVNVAGGQQPTIPELKAALPDSTEIDRTQINSWEDVEFRRAVEATGRKKLIMTALWTEVCLAFPTSTRSVRATRSTQWSTPWVERHPKHTELVSSGRPSRRAADQLGLARVRTATRLGSHEHRSGRRRHRPHAPSGEHVVAETRVLAVLRRPSTDRGGRTEGRGLRAHRGLRRHRRHAHGGAGRHDGSIDWLCFPHFDSPSVFAALLDDEQGRPLQHRPTDDGVPCKQLYWPDTNVLITRFLSPEGSARSKTSCRSAPPPSSTDAMLVRPCASCADRDVRMRLRARLRLRRACRTGPIGRTAASVRSAQARPGALERCAARIDGDARGGRFVLEGGRARRLRVPRSIRDGAPSAARHRGAGPFEDDRRLLARAGCRVHLPRSLARDRAPLGARPQAADLRADRRDRRRADVQPARAARRRRNWDYRYTWIRDAAFTLYALLRIGFTEEAAALHGLARAARCREREPDGRCRSSTASTAGASSPSRRSITSRAIAARARCASATAPTSSSSSTSTAS